MSDFVDDLNLAYIKGALKGAPFPNTKWLPRTTYDKHRTELYEDGWYINRIVDAATEPLVQVIKNE